ncbi:hypothetical protein OG948_39690 (plasmid) [Embleya sp. NBC_00888]|uniref:hypothetical protein n=1 Tax=Embleya sp. NBC_00888 TaxID=2975960 RepID=UPI002F90D38B|nr:hypothetical protein OG948_39690 [Embleya sp. NBC_00888]
MHRIALRLGVAAAAMTALATVAAGPVTAAPGTSARSEAATCTSVAVTRFDHTGYKRCDTRTMDADWNNDGNVDESFVVAPDRTIRHINAGSGGWKEMPYGFHADDMFGAKAQYGMLCVKVWLKPGIFNETLIYASCFSDGSWQPWWRIYV